MFYKLTHFIDLTKQSWGQGTMSDFGQQIFVFKNSLELPSNSANVED